MKFRLQRTHHQAEHFLHVRDVGGLVPGADFPAVLHALRRSYPGHIQLAGGKRQKITEHFPAPQMAARILKYADKTAPAVLLAHHTMNRGHRFRDLLPCLNDRAVIRSFSGQIEHIGKTQL
ncbi:Uncharacterised protein [Klebsiella variicola]|nr:Uncharacterised protein [Klebsiella variicola]SSK25029.1 Uncharacterised protein [Klebsiella pneumoniae]